MKKGGNIKVKTQKQGISFLVDTSHPRTRIITETGKKKLHVITPLIARPVPAQPFPWCGLLGRLPTTSQLYFLCLQA